MVSVLWGDAEKKQVAVLRTLYDKTIGDLSLGDWDLGFKQQVLVEDGLGALIAMCVCPGKRAPALPLHILNAAISDPHTVLLKIAARCALALRWRA